MLKALTKNTTLQLYLGTALILFIAQAIFTFNSFSQIRFEEMYESVKAVYFFDHHLIMNGLHTNVGWYSILLLVYKIFGFTLHTGQFVKLAMSGISLLCLALLFNKYFKNPFGLIPFITIGLSPTLLYFVSLNLHHAFDLQLLPICLLLLSNIDSGSKVGMTKNYMLTALLFSLMMFGVLVYPAFVFYLPSIGLFFLFQIKHKLGKIYWPFLITATVFFLLPLIIVFAYVHNRDILIYDTKNHSGIFRGGGKITFTEDVFNKGLDGILRDLFIKSGSYDFEVANVDFSDLYPIITLIMSLYICFKAFGQVKSSRKFIFLSFLVLILDLFIISVTSDYGIPGIKRGTPVLGSIYFMYTLAWYMVLENKLKLPISQTIFIIILTLIPFHHVLVYPANLANLGSPSPFKMTDWFDETQDPQLSLNNYLDTVQKTDLTLRCDNNHQKNPNCEYSFIYSAIVGSCIWNHLSCHKINGYNEEIDSPLPVILKE